MNKILEYLKTHEELLDDETIAYSKDKYPFSYEEYVSFFEALDRCYYDEHAEMIENEYFPEWRMYFELDGFKFIWRILHGQGTAYQLLRAGEKFPPEWSMVFHEDKKIVGLNKLILEEALE